MLTLVMDSYTYCHCALCIPGLLSSRQPVGQLSQGKPTQIGKINMKCLPSSLHLREPTVQVLEAGLALSLQEKYRGSEVRYWQLSRYLCLDKYPLKTLHWKALKCVSFRGRWESLTRVSNGEGNTNTWESLLLALQFFNPPCHLIIGN